MNTKAKDVQAYAPPHLEPVSTQEQAIMALVSRAATDPTFDVAKLEQLLALQEKWQATQARKDFVAAMAAFKADPPKLEKNKHVNFTSDRTQKITDYWHATDSEVTEKISAAMAKHGLSHRWNVEQSDGRIRVTCIVTHIGGHFESVAMTSSADDSGGKNSIQSIGSAVTYLRRYTLLAATGMSTGDMDVADDDGRGTSEAQCIGEGQIANIKALLTEVNASEESFLRAIKAESLSKIHVESYPMVVGIIEAKRKHV